MPTVQTGMGVVTRADNISSTMMRIPSAPLRRTAGDWVFSQDIPSDVTVVVGGIAYALHKLPLVSRSGWIRRLVAESKEPNLSKIELPDLPGGAEAFEYAAKFCYGINFEIDTKNAAGLRCAAEYLDMSEDYAEENLSSRTDTYLNEVVINSLQSCVTVLQSCESLLPLADELDIVRKCADGAALKACHEQMTPSLSRSDLSSSGRMENFGSPGNFSQTPKRKSVEWWAEEIAILRIDIFKKVILAMKSRGMRNDSLGAALAYYAQKWLRGLLKKQAGQLVEMRNRAKQMKSANDLGAMAEQEQHRVVVETLASLLPAEKGICSASFLFAFLRVASFLDASVTCRHEIERRIGWQLEQAAVDDLLIPSFSHHSDTYFDLESISRIVGHFLQQEGQGKEGEGEEEDADEESLAAYEYSSGGGISPPPQSAVMKAARVLDSFLAEVAPDANLGVSKFVAFAELMPSYARVVDDGLYRAIDIYLKAHPGVNELERKKVATLMDCQKLSQEACSHAAQNERLPVQVVVQVLYFEQMRLRSAMSGSSNLEEKLVLSPAKMNSGQLLEHVAQRRLMSTGRPTSEHLPRMAHTPGSRPRQMQVTGVFEEAELPPALPAHAIVKRGDPYNRHHQHQHPHQNNQHPHQHHQNHKEQGGHEEDGGGQNTGGTRPPQPPIQAAGYIKQEGERPRMGFFQTVTYALSKLNPFHRMNSSNDTGLKPPNTPDTRSRRPRRHSIS